MIYKQNSASFPFRNILHITNSFLLNKCNESYYPIKHLLNLKYALIFLYL